MKRSVALFLYGTPNIAGSLLGLLGLALFFTGLIKSYWFFIVVGLYGIGYLAAPRSPELDLSLKREMSLKELRAGLDGLLAQIRKRVSKPVLEKVERIVQNIHALIPHLEQMDPTDHNLHAIKQTAADYLPEMLETYLALPPAFARFHHVREGKTPRDILMEQLDLLDTEMEQILVSVHGRNMDALLAHGRFLKDKFATGRNWLN